MTNFKFNRIAIPGGNGFFGSHIVEKLKDKGVENIFIPKTSDGIDFRKYEDCEKYFSETKPDLIINCAANQGGIGYHSGRQADMYMDNVLMGSFLMLAAYKAGVQKFVNIIAGCSYPGYLEKDILNESDYWNGEVHDSIFSYGFARKTTAVYGKALQKQYGFNSIHLLMANMFGPGEHFNPVQSKALAGLIKKIYEAKKNKQPSVEIWGTGKPIRDWLYIKDGAEGVLKAAEVYDDIAPLNIASGVGISVIDLATLIKEIIGFEGDFTFNTSKPDGAMKKTFGIDKMKSTLNWEATTPLKVAIKETVDWFDKNYEYAINH